MEETMKAQKKILIVDDDPIILELYGHFLLSGGHEVVTAESGEAAMHILQEKHFDIAFIDLNMPGMTGDVLCRKIRSNYPKTICHAISGNHSFPGMDQYEKIGFRSFLQKPVSLNTILEATKITMENISE